LKIQRRLFARSLPTTDKAIFNYSALNFIGSSIPSSLIGFVTWFPW
jgi:hypothetical protein